MGVRGFYIHLFIESDDGKVSIHRDEAGHGVEVGWPRYDLSNRGDAPLILNGGTDQFGFWPHSHRVYVEAEASSKPGHEPPRVWFFDAEGKYEGEVMGSHLGDAANGRDLLVKDADDQVLRVTTARPGLAVADVRRFCWPDGSQALPLALDDDLHLGFFLRGPGIKGHTDETRRARSTAGIVLAQWSVKP